MAPLKIHNIAMGGNLRDDIMNERLKISKNLIYSRLCFSFVCSDYDLALVKKSHPLNFY